jgi:hypothetical protein
VNCGPGHIQCIYSSAYSGRIIQLNVSALLLQISRQFNVRYTAKLLPNTAHIDQFTLCELWSRPYTKNLQLHIFRLQYSAVGIYAAIVDITSIQCALYCKLGAKYSTHRSVYAMWTVVPDIYNEVTDPNIQTSIFNWTYLRCYYRYHDNSMRVILQTWCPMQRTSRSLRYVNCGPGNIQFIHNSSYSGNNIQVNVSAQLLEIIGHLEARYTANMERNIAHILRFTLCELWSRKYTMYLQLRIYRPQYSTERICAAIGYNGTFRCALHCKFGVKYSAYRPVYAVWTAVPAIFKVFTAPHSQATIFNWTYLGCKWRYSDTSMRVTLQIWSQIQRISSSLRCVNYGSVHIQSIYGSAYSGFNIQL